ADYYCCSYAGS
nr:immunoglobulin light chain junction region [Homo sapiens]